MFDHLVPCSSNVETAANVMSSELPVRTAAK
jgi:hypothetical protein